MASSCARISVIVPLLNDRDSGPACVASWLGQTYPSEHYEIVLVTPRPRGRWERTLQAKLRSGDQFLGSPAGAETLLWDFGARHARGDWVLFTEAHCLADQHCLEELNRCLASHAVAGACCQSVGIANSPAARIDARLFQQWFQQAIQPDNWRKLVMHGSVLKRRVYLELGGFDTKLGRFAEWVFERRLYDAGHRLGYAPRAIVRHVFRDSFRELVPEIVGYAAGECLFRSENPHVPLGDYTCFSAAWRTGDEPNFALARSVARDVVAQWQRRRAHYRAIPGRWRMLGRALASAGPWGRRGRVFAAWFSMQAALFKAWRRRRDETALEPFYRQLREAILRWTRFRFLAPTTPTELTPDLARGRIAIADVAQEAFVGFHCLEPSAQGPFRWTGPIAGLEFHLAPGNYHLQLRTGGIRGRVRPLIRDIILNGAAVPLDTLHDAGNDLVVPLRAEHFQRGRPQRLVLVCDPLYPADFGSTDRRELGLPLLTLEVSKAA